MQNLTLHKPTNSKIAYYTAGDKPQKIIFLHPQRSTSLRLRKIIQHFSKHFTIIAPDFPGYGQSKPLDKPHTMDNITQITAKWIDNMTNDDERYMIFGFSMGGIIATKSLKILHHKPDKMVLMGSPWKSSHLKTNAFITMLFNIIKKDYNNGKSILKIIDTILQSPKLMQTIYKTLYPNLTLKQINYEISQWSSQPTFVFIETMLDIIYNLDLTKEPKNDIPTIYLYSPEDEFTKMNKNIRSVQKTLTNTTFIPLPFEAHIPKGDLTTSTIRELQPIFKQILNFCTS